MKLISLLPHSLKLEELEKWKAKISNSRDVLELVAMYINKQLREINAKLDDTKVYMNPACDRLISGLLQTRAELKKIRELLINEESK